jgi:hypothetical protein
VTVIRYRSVPSCYQQANALIEPDRGRFKFRASAIRKLRLSAQGEEETLTEANTAQLVIGERGPRQLGRQVGDKARWPFGTDAEFLKQGFGNLLLRGLSGWETYRDLTGKFAGRNPYSWTGILSCKGPGSSSDGRIEGYFRPP